MGDTPHGRTYGLPHSDAEHFSADTTTDEEGNTYYRVRVRTEDSAEAEAVDVIPGMTAQVDILTGKRTVMQFLLKPVLRAWGNAMGER